MPRELPSDVFASRLRAERERQSMSQTQLAALIAAWLGSNVDPTVITRMEKGERAVRIDEAVAIADVLGVPLMSLLQRDYQAAASAELTRLLLDLATAQRRWEEQRLEIAQLTHSVKTLAESSGLTDHLSDALERLSHVQDPDPQPGTTPVGGYPPPRPLRPVD